MMPMRGSVWLLAAFAVAAVGDPAPAQAEKKAQTPSKEDDGWQVVQVWKAVGYNEQGHPIGESEWDPDKSKAEAEKRKMEKVEKTDGRFYAKVEVVSGKERRYVGKGTSGAKPPATLEENTRPKGGLITSPGLKPVDPGAMRWDGKGPKLAGKTGTGTIGTAKVTIKFTGDEKGGKFTVSGDLEGEGEWRPDSTASVYMETKLSAFRGVLRGDKLAGVRLIKKPGEDGKNASTEWSVTLADSPKVDPKAFRVEYQLKGAETTVRYYATQEEAKAAAYAFIDKNSEPNGFFIHCSVLIYDNKTGKHLETKTGKKGRL
jgi:hypothetical protein